MKGAPTLGDISDWYCSTRRLAGNLRAKNSKLTFPATQERSVHIKGTQSYAFVECSLKKSSPYYFTPITACMHKYVLYACV
jgi:hypothetical protein